ncbi:MAG: 4Fe-4S dicluster domain-containing protein [Acidocella sp.]|nr:4Fe-4S dicluster domain-containing protein [Acidocella sp.]
MIELIFAERCTQCHDCVSKCPSNVFDIGADGAPVIARQEDCQTCYMCEMYCRADALFIGSDADTPEHPAPQTVLANGWLGELRRNSGWDEWATDPRYKNQMWYMNEVFKRGLAR